MSVGSIYLERANYAHEKIIAYKRKDGVSQPKMKSYARTIPTYIKTNGLLATIAFINSKKNSKNTDNIEYMELYTIIVEWLKNDVLHNEFQKESDLFKILSNLSSSEYKHVERETLCLLQWVSRLAEGELEGEENG